MKRLLFQTSIETYPYMIRMGRKWVKSADYLAHRVYIVRLQLFLYRDANAPKQPTVVILKDLSPRSETQMTRIETQTIF